MLNKTDDVVNSNTNMELKLKLLYGFVLLLFLSPYFLFGENARIWTHDNLDSVFIYLKALANSGKLCAPNNAIIPDMMHGLPRACFGSEYNFTMFLYYFFNSFTAYTINLVFLHAVAMIGSVLLLKKFVLPHQSPLVIYSLALCFALMPFWSHACLSIAGQPLLLYAFLNIRNHTQQYTDWLIIVLFPLFSILIFSPIFFIFCISVFWLYDSIKHKKINWLFLFSIFLITCVYLLVEYRLVLSFFVAPDFISHRTEFSNQNIIASFKTVLTESWKYFKSAQYHANSIHFPYVFLLSAISLILAFIYKNKQGLKIGALLILAGSIMFFYKFMDYEKMIQLTKNIKILTLFQVDRFYTLFPLIWFLILALSSDVILKVNKKIFSTVLLIFLCVQIGFSFYSSPTFRYSYSERLFPKTKFPEKITRFKDFYAESVFLPIKNGINEPQTNYHIVNIGIDPAITVYNGFQNLDMYVANYPLDYKHKFREIMVKELDKNPKKKKYFDKWGSRCYIFASEADSTEINNLELNYEVLKSMDCRFLFSSKKINNVSQNLKFIYCVPGNDYLKEVYIYKVL
jgi:hypothetical protein